MGSVGWRFRVEVHIGCFGYSCLFYCSFRWKLFYGGVWWIEEVGC